MVGCHLSKHDVDARHHVARHTLIQYGGGSGSPRRRISWKNSRQFAVSSLLPGAGAVPNMMQPAAEQSIAVYGVGGVGLAGLMAARIAGCDPIIAVDRLPSRLVLPRELGATHTLGSCGAEALAEIRKIIGGGTDFALEASAEPAVFRLAVDVLRGLGTCILVGNAAPARRSASLQGGRIVRGVIQGDSRPRDFIPRLVDLFMAGRMRLDRFITRYDFATSTARPPRRPRAL